MKQQIDDLLAYSRVNRWGNEFADRAGYDESRGDQDEQRFEKAGYVFELTVAEGMACVGRLVRLIDGKERNGGGEEVDPGVNRLGQDRDRAHQHARRNFEDDQQAVRNDRYQDDAIFFHMHMHGSLPAFLFKTL